MYDNMTNYPVRSERFVQLDVRLGSDERTISLSMSSEAPVMRDGFREILDHTPSGVDLGRAMTGLPLLADHDQQRQIGVVENVRIMGRRLEGNARFGESRDATEVWSDVKSGVLRNISVGYLVHEYRKEAGDVLRAIRWEPFEVSIVSVPADPTVGINRSMENGNMNDSNPVIAARPKSVTLGDRQRSQELLGLGRQFDCLEDAQAAIGDGTSVADFQRQILDKIASAPETVTRSRAIPNFEFGGNREQARAAKFSVAKLVQAKTTGDFSCAGLEVEVSQELSRQLGRKPEGIFIPSFALAKRSVLATLSGSALLGEEHLAGAFINSLRDEVAIMELGATVLHGLTQDVVIPRLVTGTASQWVDEGAEPMESDPAFDIVSLSYHQLSSTMRYTRKMAVQSDPSIEALMRQDMRNEVAVALDRAAINGQGAFGEPQGILTRPGVGVVDFGTDGGPIDWLKTVEFLAKVESASAAVGQMGWLTNAKVKAAMLSTPRVPGQADFIMDDAMGGTVAGYKAAITNLAPSNGTKGSGNNLSSLVFGNWQDLLVGEFGAIDLVVDPYSESSRGNVRISLHSSWDINVRHEESFAVATDIAT